MSKINEIAAEFADLNLQIIQNIQKRGYSPREDVETLATVRENLKVLKDFNIESEPQAVPTDAAPVSG